MSKKKSTDLENGSIGKLLVTLAVPSIIAQIVNLLYNIVDRIFIGRMPNGDLAMAGIGIITPIVLLVTAFSALVGFGGSPRVAIKMGQKDNDGAEEILGNSFSLVKIIGLILTVIFYIFKEPIVMAFGASENTAQYAIDYLSIYLIGTVFVQVAVGMNPYINTQGFTTIGMVTVAIGAGLNIILDPILIFGIGKVSPLGVKGAALATVLSQLLVTIIFIYVFIKNGYNFNLYNKKFINLKYIKNICKYGGPTAIQNCLFTFFAMLIGRIVAVAGPVAIAVQKVGSQIESISWMTAGGFASALTAFVGQNYGAKRMDRVLKGYKSTLLISCILGLFTTIVLIVFGEKLFSIFINETEAIKQGADYLRILGYSQLFMCIEITTNGAFYGMGKTITPSIIGIIFTGLRVPLAMLLFNIELLGINGIWWSISSSSIIKGVLLITLFTIMVVRPLRKEIVLEF